MFWKTRWSLLCHLQIPSILDGAGKLQSQKISQDLISHTFFLGLSVPWYFPPESGATWWVGISYLNHFAYPKKNI